MPGRRTRNVLRMLLLLPSFLFAGGRVIDNFQSDFSGNASDTSGLGIGWSNTLEIYSPRSNYAHLWQNKLNEGNPDNFEPNVEAAMPTVRQESDDNFSVMFLSWNSPTPPGNVIPVDIIKRKRYTINSSVVPTQIDTLSYPTVAADENTDAGMPPSSIDFAVNSDGSEYYALWGLGISNDDDDLRKSSHLRDAINPVHSRAENAYPGVSTFYGDPSIQFIDADNGEMVVAHNLREGGQTDTKVIVSWENIDGTIHEQDTIAAKKVDDIFAFPRAITVEQDNNGNVAVVYMLQTLNTRGVYMQLYDNNRNIIMADTLIQDTINIRQISMSQSRIYGFKAIGPQQFVLAYHMDDEIKYRMITPSANPIIGAEQTLAAIPADNYKWARINVDRDRKFLLFSYYAIEGTDVYAAGTRYDILGGSIAPNTNFSRKYREDPITFVEGNPYTASQRHLHDVNFISAAIDGSGNIVATYNHERGVNIDIWANAPQFIDSARFKSAVLEIENPDITANFDTSIDSVMFIEADYGSDSNVVLMFQVSEDQIMDDPLVNDLRATIDTSGLFPDDFISNAQYYQYEFKLGSNPDSTYTPVISQFNIDWNVKPRQPVIDSIKVGDFLPWEAFDPNKTYKIINRFDRVYIKFRAFDFDYEDGFDAFILNSGTRVDSLIDVQAQGNGFYEDTLTIEPLDIVAIEFDVTLNTRDKDGWFSSGQLIHLSYINIPPVELIDVDHPKGDGTGDTSYAVFDGTRIRVNVGDSSYYRFFATDTNDPVINIVVENSKNSVSIDTNMNVGDSGSFTLEPHPIDTNPYVILDPLIIDLSVDTLSFNFIDPDTTVVSNVYLVPNHAPFLDSVSTVGYFLDGEYVEDLVDRNFNPRIDEHIFIHPEIDVAIQAHHSDVDEVNLDSSKTFWYLLTRDENNKCCLQDSIHEGDTLIHRFGIDPPLVRIVTKDISGIFTEDTFDLKFPYLDTSFGEGNIQEKLNNAIDSLTQKGPYILGVSDENLLKDTVTFNLRSNGTTVLRIDSIWTINDNAQWLSYKILWRDSNQTPLDLVVTENTDSSYISSANVISLLPGDSLHVEIYLDFTTMEGDSLIQDTLFFRTNDFLNRLLSVPLRFEYDDLPFVTIQRIGRLEKDSVQYDLLEDQRVPMLSSVLLAFSEPMRVDSLNEFVKIYSYRDSLFRGLDTYDVLNGEYPNQFNVRYANTSRTLMDSLIFTPYYRAEADYTALRPPPYMFIPADSIQVYLSNGLRDDDGNALDLRRNKVPMAVNSLDTIHGFHVDSTVLKVLSSYPVREGIYDPSKEIEIHFGNKLVETGIFDTDTIISVDQDSLRAGTNRTLQVLSAFNGWQPVDLAYLRLDNNDSLIRVKTLKKLYAGDSIRLEIYSNVTDVNGNTVESPTNDGDNAGVGSFIFHRDPTRGTYMIPFRVDNIGFYNYPNPFDFNNPDHVDKGSISFKNLNNIPGISQGEKVEVRIYSVSGELVYSSERKNTSIRFEEGLDDAAPPEFEWNLRNNHGLLVATGMYIYTVSTKKDGVLQKGKVAVIR